MKSKLNLILTLAIIILLIQNIELLLKNKSLAKEVYFLNKSFNSLNKSADAAVEECKVAQTGWRNCIEASKNFLSH